MGGVVANPVEILVLLVDAAAPSLGAPTWLVAPCERADRADGQWPVAREVEQLDRRRWAYPRRARVRADPHFWPLTRVSLCGCRFEGDREIQNTSACRILPRPLPPVSYVRVETVEWTVRSRRHPVPVGVLVVDADHRVARRPSPRWGIRGQRDRRIAEGGYHAAGVSDRAASTTRATPPRRASPSAGGRPSRSGEGVVAQLVKDNAPPGKTAIKSARPGRTPSS